MTNVRITENGITYMGGNKVVNGVELALPAASCLAWASSAAIPTWIASKEHGAGNIANGMPFANTPKHSFSLWTSYKPMPKLTLGLGVYAQSSVNHTLSTVDGGIVTKGANGYARVDAMMAYQFNKNMAFQLNVYNLGDKTYYSGVPPHYATIAAGRGSCGFAEVHVLPVPRLHALMSERHPPSQRRGWSRTGSKPRWHTLPAGLLHAHWQSCAVEDLFVMMLRIPGLLSPDEVRQCRKALQEASWQDGRATAGHLAAQVKSNQQLPLDSAVGA